MTKTLAALALVAAATLGTPATAMAASPTPIQSATTIQASTADFGIMCRLFPTLPRCS